MTPTRSTGKGCYRWGKTGKRYCGAGAKAKADKQGRAVRAAQARRGKRS